jgi:hypothetical protein
MFHARRLWPGSDISDVRTMKPTSPDNHKTPPSQPHWLGRRGFSLWVLSGRYWISKFPYGTRQNSPSNRRAIMKSSSKSSSNMFQDPIAAGAGIRFSLLNGS